MTHIKDFLDSNILILDKFKEVAPGSYRHCANVAQLCTSLSKELSLDIDALIPAAMLHDIGKCLYPANFIENQIDEKNIHDNLDPLISYHLISRHVSDSVLKLIQINAPLDIIKIVSEHHGSTTVRSVYARAKEFYKSGVVEEDFKYHAAPPSTIEACVLMCCDVVESACKALANAGKLLDHKSIVDKLIDSISDEGQLDILSVGQLRVIKKVLTSEITAIYHKRVVYEDDENKIS